MNNSWDINLGGTPDNLELNGANIFVHAGTVELFPTRRDSNYIYCTVSDGTAEGDVNGDGSVDVADIATIIDVMASTAVTAGNADVNGDGTVDVADIASVIDIMAANARRAQ